MINKGRGKYIENGSNLSKDTVNKSEYEDLAAARRTVEEGEHEQHEREPGGRPTLVKLSYFNKTCRAKREDNEKI